MKVTLPWPSPALSPNARGHWAKSARAKKSYRQIAWALACEAGLRGVFDKDAELTVELAFYPPDRRRRDKDNIVASMKAAIDGLADALGVDDSRFTYVYTYPPETGGRVEVIVSGVRP